MNPQLRTSLTAAALSEDGKWLAVADAFETKLYKLRADVSADIVMRLPPSLYLTDAPLSSA
jgi:U3 small nucleolar RNA-associated protein 4